MSMNKWFQLAQIFATLAGLFMVAVGFGYSIFLNATNQNLDITRFILTSNLTEICKYNCSDLINSFSSISNSLSETAKFSSNFSSITFNSAIAFSFLALIFALAGFIDKFYEEKTSIRKKIIEVIFFLISVIIFIYILSKNTIYI